MDFNALRNSMNSADNFEAMQKKVEEANSNGSGQDTFMPAMDPAKKAKCIVRLLPGKDGQTHIVSYRRFNFRVGSKTYNNLSRRTIGEADPAQEYKSALWNSTGGKGDAHKFMTARYTNKVWVQVIDDKVDPSQNGKVLPWYCPMKIKDLIENAIKPEKDEYADVQPTPFNPFNPFGDSEYAGRNLVIDIRPDPKTGYNNYDMSKFEDKPSALAGGDEGKMQEILEQVTEDLSVWISKDSDKYKPYDELLKQLIDVVGLTTVARETFGEKLVELGLIKHNAIDTMSAKDAQVEDEIIETKVDDKPSAPVDDDFDDFDVD